MNKIIPAFTITENKALSQFKCLRNTHNRKFNIYKSFVVVVVVVVVFF